MRDLENIKDDLEIQRYWSMWAEFISGGLDDENAEAWGFSWEEALKSKAEAQEEFYKSMSEEEKREYFNSLPTYEVSNEDF